jgi:hypothetical protein
LWYIECGSTAVRQRSERTAQGDRRFAVATAVKSATSAVDSLLNRSQYPSDVIALVVLWRLCYKLSVRDLPEMFLICGARSVTKQSVTRKLSSRQHWLKVCAVANAATWT